MQIDIERRVGIRDVCGSNDPDHGTRRPDRHGRSRERLLASCGVDADHGGARCDRESCVVASDGAAGARATTGLQQPDCPGAGFPARARKPRAETAPA